MFYNETLMNSKTLGKAWRAANNVSIDTEEAAKDLPKICNKINRWVGSEAETVDGRMSLRASSALVGGVAKIFKTGVEQLYDDVNKLDEVMLRRKRQCSMSTVTSESYTTSASEHLATPEEMRQHAHMQAATSLTPRKRCKTMSVPPKMSSVEHTMEVSGNTSFIDRRLSEENNNLGPQNTASGQEERPIVHGSAPSVSEDTHPETRDQGTQTSPILPIGLDDGFDPNLPFGYVIIHESYSSRIPSRIIFSSINRNVDRLN